MKLFLLERPNATIRDERCRILVRSTSVKAARKLAAITAGDEKSTVWLSTETSTCKEVKTEGKPEIILVQTISG